MNDPTPLHMLIVDPSANDAASVVSILRSAGYAAHAEHIDRPEAIEAHIARERCDLLVCRHATADYHPRDVFERVRRADSDIPLLLLEGEHGLTRLAAGFELGATDVLFADEPERLQHVVARELANLRARRARRHAEDARADAERRLELVLTTANTAIAFVHAGMHVHANEAYLALFGYEGLEDLTGVPLLDLIAPESQTVVRERLRALAVTHDDEPVRFLGVARDGARLPARMALAQATCGGEACLQVLVHRDAGSPQGTRCDAPGSIDGSGPDDADGVRGVGLRAAGPPAVTPPASEPGALVEQRARSSAQALVSSPATLAEGLTTAVTTRAAQPNPGVERLTRAMHENTLVLLFQPIVSLQDESGERYEVYLRLPDEEGSLLRPDEFMELAEQAGLGGRLDRWVVLHTIKKLSYRRSEGYATRVTINLTHAALLDSFFVPWLRVALKAAKLPRGTVALQLTEDAAQRYPSETSAFIEALSKLDCTAGMSHFRASTRSFALLDDIAAGFVKLDTSLVTQLDADSGVQETLRDAVATLRARGRRTIVPMIDSAGRLARIFPFGAEYVQGDYLQPPTTEMDFDFAMDI